MIKKVSFLFLTLFISSNAIAQIDFQKGYFITNNNERKACLIRDLDWKNNPVSFEYKLTENSKTQIGDINDIREFGIDENSKFIRKKVEINRSSDLDESLEHDREITSREEELFLKVIVEGNAILYYYEEGNLRRFFYAIDEFPVKSLGYKRYMKSNSVISENNEYRQELYNNLKCKDLTRNRFAKLKYGNPSLVALFQDYNQCIDPNYVPLNIKRNKTKINLSLRPGINFSTTSTKNTTGTLGQVSFDTEFESKINFRFGLEMELVLPFNKSKWSILLEPTYRNYQASSTESENSLFDNFEIDYESIEIALGVRHSIYLKDKAKLFLTGYMLNDWELDSKLLRIIGPSVLELEINPLSNFGMGLGYKSNGGISVEFRWDSSRNLFRDSFWTSGFRNVSLILGYTII